MGAAAATAKQPLTEVDIKNEIGVLYGEEAQQAFAAAEEEDVVAWPKVQAYAEAHGLLDPKSVLFKNLGTSHAEWSWSFLCLRMILKHPRPGRPSKSRADFAEHLLRSAASIRP